MRFITAILLLACMHTAGLALDLVDDPVYRRMAAGLEAKSGRTANDDLRLAEIYGDAREYAKGEALYRQYLSIAERYPLIYGNLSVFAGKQAKYAEAVEWADKAIAAAARSGASGGGMHPTLVKASWLWESGERAEATALFSSVAVPPAGDPQESLYWGCRACFYASVGDQQELQAAIGTCLDLGDEHFATFIRRDTVFDRYRAEKWFIALVGTTLAP